MQEVWDNEYVCVCVCVCRCVCVFCASGWARSHDGWALASHRWLGWWVTLSILMQPRNIGGDRPRLLGWCSIAYSTVLYAMSSVTGGTTTRRVHDVAPRTRPPRGILEISSLCAIIIILCARGSPRKLFAICNCGRVIRGEH